MLRASLVIMAILCTLLLVPFAAAQAVPDPGNGGFENLCAPVDDLEFDYQSLTSMLTHQQLESVQIELLERGWVTDFASDAEIGTVQLTDAVAQFQAANNIPATGNIDAQTLDALGIPNPKSDGVAFEVNRAKPSK
jgi:peptidoglycan hydrolase-like protein with peptidoglycan-binding domain